MSGISHLQPRTVEGTKPSKLWRIGRAANPLYFSTISVTDADLPNAGNRFDVAGGGVLYAATDLKGCYLETLARFRPSARVREAVQGQDGHFMICGGVPADWRSQRVKAILALASPLPFLDVEAPETHEYLTTAMAPELAGLPGRALDPPAWDRRAGRGGRSRPRSTRDTSDFAVGLRGGR